MGDTIVHGTRAWGERHGSAKLTLQQVLQIRASQNVSQQELAERFGVYQSCISNIRAGRRWAHAGGLQ
jgi:DNA-binding transcriptional regulator YiaG